MPSQIPTHRPGSGLPLLDRSPAAIHRARFYRSQEWKRVRGIHLIRQPLCQLCLKNDRLVPAAAVHHLETIEARPDRALDMTNLESICTSCHSALHAHKAKPKPGASAPP
jgi:5-methylcytosine-specific restriction enzyme A